MYTPLQIKNLIKNNICLFLISVLIVVFLCGYLINMVVFLNSNLENFENENETENEKKLVYYYMNGCGYCDKFTPIWNEFKNSYTGPLNIKKLERADAKEDLEKYEISGFPAIILLDSNNNKIKEFDGERTVDGLNSFINSN